MLAMLAAEFPFVPPHLYDLQILPVVYLSGVLMFIGGLVIVSVHNSWVRDWTILVTLSGWFLLLLGLFRMFVASSYQRAAAGASTPLVMMLEGTVPAVALFMTFKAYVSR